MEHYDPNINGFTHVLFAFMVVALMVGCAVAGLI